MTNMMTGAREHETFETGVAPPPERPVARCKRCRMVQYVTAREACRRCGTALVDRPVVVEAPQAIPLSAPELRRLIATNLQRYRMAAGHTQRVIATRMGVEHSWVSRLEGCLHAFLPASVERVATALGIPMTCLLVDDTDEMVRVALAVRRLSGPQRAEVLARVRQLVAGKRVQ